MPARSWLCVFTLSTVAICGTSRPAAATPGTYTVYGSGNANLQTYTETIDAATDNALTALQRSCNGWASYNETALLHDVKRVSQEVHPATGGYIVLVSLSGACTVSAQR
jgi:hypothetical protein